MIPLPEIHQRYKTEHPHYFHTLARFDPSDQKLESLKRKALLPFFETLEEKNDRLQRNDGRICRPFRSRSRSLWIQSSRLATQSNTCPQLRQALGQSQTLDNPVASGKKSGFFATESTACPMGGPFGPRKVWSTRSKKNM